MTAAPIGINPFETKPDTSDYNIPNQDNTILIGLLEKQIALNEEKNQLLEQHYQDMKKLATSYAEFAFQLLGQQKEFPQEPEEEESFSGGELTGLVDRG